MGQYKAIKDKNDNFLKIGDKVKDAKGNVWKLENIGGVALMVYPHIGDIKKTQVIRKVDFTQYEKVD